MPGDAEPDVSPELTPPEEQLLALIREGRVDAEIAVRLGITNREVKERIERLVLKLGVRDRAELRDGPPTDEQPSEPVAPARELSRINAPPGRRLDLPLVAGLLILAVLGFAAVTFVSRSSQVDVVVVQATAAPTTAPAAVTVEIAGREMYDLGPLFKDFSEGGVTSAARSGDSLKVDYSGRLYVRVTLSRVTSRDVFQLVRFSESDTELEGDTPVGRVRLTLNGHFGRDRSAVQKDSVSLESVAGTGTATISAQLVDGPGCCQPLELEIVGARLYLATPPAELTIPTVRVAGRDMVDLGPVVTGPPDATFRSEAREDLLVYEPAAGTLLDLSSWQITSASPDGFEATRSVSGRALYLSAQASGGASLARGGPGALFSLIPGTSVEPALVLWAGSARGESGLHLELDTTGRLFVAPEPGSSANVLVAATGELLDVRAAAIVGRAPLSGGFTVVTDCAVSADACVAFVYADSPEIVETYALAPGEMTCRDGDAVRLDLGAVSLLFQEVDRTGTPKGSCLPLATQYFNNDGSFHPPHIALSYTTSYRIAAVTREGRPLSVVVANDRTIYVGDLLLKSGCPAGASTSLAASQPTPAPATYTSAHGPGAFRLRPHPR